MVARPANLHTLARFWTNSTSSLRSTPGSTGCAEFRALDRHEIDELARTGEAERLYREHARGLGQRLDDQHAGHDRARREMALEEGLVDRHRLDRDDPLFGIEALDAIDEEHRIAMRQRRHDPPDVQRADGRCRSLPSFGLSGPAVRLRPRRRRRRQSSEAQCSARQARRWSRRRSRRRQRRTDFDQQVRAATLHDLLVDRVELVLDLLLDVLLVALDLLLLSWISCAPVAAWSGTL